MTIDNIHPELQRAMNAIELPEVEEMMKSLAKYGLAVGVPHMHGENGGFYPLPDDKVALEIDPRTSFRNSDDPELQTAVPVMWRYSWDAEKGVPTAKCNVCFCTAGWHHK